MAATATGYVCWRPACPGTRTPPRCVACGRPTTWTKRGWRCEHECADLSFADLGIER